MKSAEELHEAVKAIIADGVNITMYFGVGGGKTRTYERANLVDKATDSVFSNYAAGIGQFFDNEELMTRRLSRIDQRASCLWFYDLGETPDEFAQLEAIQAGQVTKIFSFNERAVGDIKMIAVSIASAANAVLFVRKFYPVSLIKRDQLLLVKSADRLDVFNEDIIKVGFGFEILLIGGEFYINEFAKFEKAFSFEAIAERTRKKVTRLILDLDIVNDAKGYIKDGRISKKDILRTSGSVVFSLKPSAIVKFATAKQKEIGLEVVGGKLQLNSLGSIKKLFNLLNDDYLSSGLTALEYESLAKNEITVKEQS